MGLHAGRRRSKRAARLQRADLRARDGNNGRYYPQADARLANNPDLAPGINCCAVCARQFITKVCPVSRRVRYCSAHHMLLDAKARAPSMRVLRTLEKLEDDGEPVSIERDELGLARLANDGFGVVEITPPAWAYAETMSYPLSVAHCLTALSPFRKVTKRAQSDAIRIVIVGASDAEAAASPHVWLDCFRRAGLRGSFTVVLVGPELSAQDPTEAWKETCDVRLEYLCETAEDILATADAIVGFNLGLTVDAYDWGPALERLPAGKPIAFFTNSLPELKAELEVYELVCRVRTCRPNPFRSPRWRQSTSMANDIYRRHSYVVAGTVEV
jgi:hypothetical protein